MSFSRLPSGKAFLIVPNDDENLPPVDQEGAIGVAVYIGVGGQLTYNDSSDTTSTITVSSGQMLGELARRIYSTGTTASNMFGTYKVVSGGDFSNTQWQLSSAAQWNLITDTWS